MTSPETNLRNPRHLTVDTAAVNEDNLKNIDGGHNDPKTPPGVRGHSDLRSPGVKKTPLNADRSSNAASGFDDDDDAGDNDPAPSTESAPPTSPLANFITQTDAYGNASTPRTADGITAARRMHPSGPQPKQHVNGETGKLSESHHPNDNGAVKNPATSTELEADACDTLLDSFRMMCCCLLPEDGTAAPSNGTSTGNAKVANDHKDGCTGNSTSDTNNSTPSHPIGYSTRGHDAPLLLEQDSALRNNPNNIRLLPELHAQDSGKKCLVLDLDETLVHSSFRAVPGADFVIPVQIEDVVHFVYVAKRPGVDEFLIEMAKHYEIVIYTASLNKYADVLLDLLDPQRVIRTRLFRESCVFYEGNYVKDLCLLNRPLEECIIIDNSPASYMFHPENAIDCGSFIDDVNDVELDQIGNFLVGCKDV
eukprot:CAMPEP_0172301092 /NCGR_PEP_ID=MMETSP1058-20130122/3045_1 /TAXON_ID=83371 /ORGANISM="Detonula confervacea, Strain CCMP 353" /LENGTH=421 /DNA_ID=CAMNT_0013011089 /DNA_START=109 /DNA_END=1370 /DNA_ORIENTATION=+